MELLDVSRLQKKTETKIVFYDFQRKVELCEDEKKKKEQKKKATGLVCCRLWRRLRSRCLCVRRVTSL